MDNENKDDKLEDLSHKIEGICARLTHLERWAVQQMTGSKATNSEVGYDPVTKNYYDKSSADIRSLVLVIKNRGYSLEEAGSKIIREVEAILDTAKAIKDQGNRENRHE